MSTVGQISGTLTIGPTGTVDPTSSFPIAVDSTPLSLYPSQKPFAVDTGIQHPNVNSTGAYVPLLGVGALTDGAAVSQGTFLYMRTKTPMLVKLTVNNGGVPLVIADIPVNGLLILEFDATKYLTALAVQGSGVVEWFVGGQL